MDDPAGWPRRARVLTRAALTLALALGALTCWVVAAQADAATPTLTVNAAAPFRAATHVASGALYGLATDAIPAEGLVSALKPNTFVQMAPNGRQLPNGETSPAGDVLNVLKLAHQAGAKVVVRMPDWFPTFPYSASGTMDISQWESEVDNQVELVEKSPYRSAVSAFAIWNEPNLNWTGSITDDSGNPLDFNTFWEDTYREIRSIDPTAEIQGPSFSDYNSGSCSTSDMTATSGADCGSIEAFLQFAASTNTVPDIISWHELGGQASIDGDVADYRSWENLVIGQTLPIAIEEYGEPDEMGIPGDLVGYIAKFERAGVNNAELAFWNEYGSLGDTLTGTGGAPNGAYWLYRWYATMQGQMLTTTPTNVAATSNFDGAAALSKNKQDLSVIVGGNSGATQVSIDGLSHLKLGKRINVSLQYVPSYGRHVPVAGPLTLSDSVATATNGTLTVAIPDMNAADGYRVVLTPARTAALAPGATYRIANANSGLAIAPTGDASGPAVAQATATSAASNQWKIEPAGKDDYTIQNVSDSLYLTSGGSAGADVNLQAADASADELWTLADAGAGDRALANVATGYVLGIQGRSTAPGAAAIEDQSSVPTPVCTATSVRVAGEFGNAVSLCGDGEYVSMPAGIVSGLTGDYTISTWIKPQANTQWSRVFDFGTGTTNYMYLTVDNAGGDVRFAISTSGPSGEQAINSSYPVANYGAAGVASFANSSAALLPINQWSLITVTVAGNTGILYVDGTAVGENDSMTLTPSALGDTTQNWIGRSEFGDPYFDGAVDDFNIYSSALSAGQVAALATDGTPGSGNIADYAFDESSGSSVADSSGNDQTATIVSDPTNSATEVGSSADEFWRLTKVSR